MENIDFSQEIYSYDIELSLFVEALTKAEPRLEISQFGRVIPPEPFFPEV